MLIIFLLTTAFASLNSGHIQTKQGEYKDPQHPQVQQYSTPAFENLRDRCAKKEEAALNIMFAEFDKMITGRESYLFLALQPIYNFKNEVVQFEILLRYFADGDAAFFPLFHNLNEEQWKDFIMLNANFAREMAALTNVPISFNLPAFLLVGKHAEFHRGLIQTLREQHRVIVEISETGFRGKPFVNWIDEYTSVIKNTLFRGGLTLALDDISAWKVETQNDADPYPMTLALAKDLENEVGEVKLDMPDTALLFKTFSETIYPVKEATLDGQLTSKVLPKQSEPLNTKEQYLEAFKDGIFNELVKPALESRKKVVFEFSVQDALKNLKDEHQQILAANEDLVMIQGGKTGAFALSKDQVSALMDERRA